MINVGGIKHPIGESKVQKIIAKSMSHPLCFGGGKFRNPNFKGNAETVYLGAFNRNKMPLSLGLTKNTQKLVKILILILEYVNLESQYI